MLLPDGGSVRGAHRAPPPAPTPQQGQSFDAAVKKAQSDRAAADGKPNAQRGNEIAHQAKPGDTLSNISQEYRAPFSGVLEANRQLGDPNHIQAGQVVFVPDADPDVIEARQAVANARQGDTEAEARRRWTELQSSIEGEIRNAGRSATFPDDAIQSTVTEVRGRVPDDPRYQAIVDEAVAKIDQEWRDGGITRGEIDGLVQDAQAADRSVASLEDLAHTPGATPAERRLAIHEWPEVSSAASAAWGKVRSEVANDLRAEGTGQAYPEELVRSRVDEIKRQYANDPKVQDTVDAAYRTVTDEWRAQGWTRDTLGKVVDRYDTVKQDQRAVDAARASGSADLPTLQSQLEDDRTALREEIEQQLDDVAGKVEPEEREMAIAARAALIERHGSDDQAFKDIVDQAAYDKLVQPGVDAVRNAYQSDGAKAAAETLREQTENASPETAARIVANSTSTIENIAVDIKHSLTDGGPIAHEDVTGVYADVATATDYAARADNGAQVTADVAQVMLRHMPTNKFDAQTTYPTTDYQQVVELSVSKGTGATLALEMTVQLKEAGRTDEAASLLSATRSGVVLLGGNIENGVNDFRNASAVISQLRADWADFMTQDQLDRATLAYVDEHSDILPNFERTHNVVDDLGYGAARTSMAINAALPRLRGLDGAEDLTEALGDFADADETKLAAGISDKATDEVLRIVLEQEAAGTPSGASVTSSASRTRGFVKEVGNSLLSFPPASVITFADVEVTVDPKKTSLFGGTMNGLGAAFAGHQTLAAWDKLGSGQLLDRTKTVYYTIGAFKEGWETVAVVAQNNLLDRVPFLNRIPERWSASTLAAANRTGLAHEPGWVKFSTYFKIGGGVIDAASAIDAAGNGDWIAAGLYTTSSGGGFLAAGGSVAPKPSWLASGGVMGTGLALASALGLYAHYNAEANAHMEGPSREFLETAGFRPEVAEELADYSNYDGHSAGPAIAATAQQFGVTPEQLMERLNRMDPQKVHDLVMTAWSVKPDDSGQFPLTAPNDRNIWAPPSAQDPPYGRSYLYDQQDTQRPGEYISSERMPDGNPHSMTALRNYARALFGEPVLG